MSVRTPLRDVYIVFVDPRRKPLKQEEFHVYACFGATELHDVYLRPRSFIDRGSSLGKSSFWRRGCCRHHLPKLLT